MTWHIHQLIDRSTGEVVYYEPALRNEIYEIALAIKAAREANLRQMLHQLKEPRPREIKPLDDVDTVATQLFLPH